ncbi:MAG: hrpB 1, partial [Verrucomicrobiaceae bacterium]|nr:hrpB 1 [Verrucomicrobiaceae bacterium]
MPPTIRYPADLPITARREEIVAAIRDHQVIILAGETGSGKTTQLPKMCLEALPDQRGQIGCTQPRRVAAMSVSKRVAEELNVRWGGEVGCKMRFSDDTSRDTRIKFMTDGILLAEIQSDPLLRSYSMLILDEAHERSLNIDFLLGYLVGLLKKRPDLKVLVTSATIDTEAFSQAFGGAPIIEVSGRLYPVDIRYAPINSGDDDYGYIDATISAVEDALIETDTGDVLVFMPTERDIRDTRDLLDGRLGRDFEVLALFGRMASAEQQKIFSPGSKRRVVIATNVAETSITIPRVRYVVDTGLARISRYNPRTRTKRLPVEAVSQSSANQRAGRAGRVQDGVCIRLYSQEDFEKRDRFTMPEIQRANLAEVILRMKAYKLGEIETFPFINPPVSASIRAGYDLLHELGSLDETHELTPLGRELAKLPLDPTLGRMLLQAREEKALPEMLVIAAGLSIPDPRERPEEKKEMAAAAH